MTALLVKTLLMFFLIKLVILENGYVSEVKMNTKAHCYGFSKEVVTVKSEMQCVHNCLRKRCNLLNYNAKGKKKENCEVMKKVGKCKELSHQSEWKLMTFVVREYDVNLSECLIYWMISKYPRLRYSLLFYNGAHVNFVEYLQGRIQREI